MMMPKIRYYKQCGEKLTMIYSSIGSDNAVILRCFGFTDVHKDMKEYIAMKFDFEKREFDGDIKEYIITEEQAFLELV